MLDVLAEAGRLIQQQEVDAKQRLPSWRCPRRAAAFYPPSSTLMGYQPCQTHAKRTYRVKGLRISPADPISRQGARPPPMNAQAQWAQGMTEGMTVTNPETGEIQALIGKSRDPAPRRASTRPIGSLGSPRSA